MRHFCLLFGTKLVVLDRLPIAAKQKMKNRIKISTDGINVYATLDVNASKIGVRILGVMLFVKLLF